MFNNWLWGREGWVIATLPWPSWNYPCEINQLANFLTIQQLTILRVASGEIWGEKYQLRESLKKTLSELERGDGNSRIGKRQKDVEEIIKEDRIQGTDLRPAEEDGGPLGV